jgi:hypothetical protein
MAKLAAHKNLSCGPDINRVQTRLASIAPNCKYVAELGAVRLVHQIACKDGTRGVGLLDPSLQDGRERVERQHK